jgi:PhnB protein
LAHVATYLNLPGTTEEAFTFYKAVFGTEFSWPLMRVGDLPAMEGHESLTDEAKNLVMNVGLPILGGHLLMGTDVTGDMGGPPVHGDGAYICLMPDTREEADRLFAALSEGGTVQHPMKDEVWGDYFGQFIDRFGVFWMINQSNQPAG